VNSTGGLQSEASGFTPSSVLSFHPHRIRITLFNKEDLHMIEKPLQDTPWIILETNCPHVMPD